MKEMRFPLTFFLLRFAILSVLIATNSSAHNPLSSSDQRMTGSPLDGTTCFSCHSISGSPVNPAASMAFSASPALTTTYTPGTSYAITLSMTAPVSAGNRSGFEITAENATAKAGTFTAGGGSKIVGTSSFVGHNSAPTATNPSWTFAYLAPTAGKGQICFYAIGAPNSSGQRSAEWLNHWCFAEAAGATPAVLATLSPASALAAGPAFTLTANGSNLLSGTVVNWNGSPRTTTFVSAAQVTAAITASDIAAAGTNSVTVTNPGAAASNALTVAVNNPAPGPLTLSPASATTGGAAFTLTVNGGSFVNGSVVRWNGINLTTIFVNTTQLTATVPSADMAAPGTASVTVFNATPGGGTSAASTFSINNPLPVLSSLSPGSAGIGSPALSLVVGGSRFVNGAVVTWNGATKTTTFNSSTQLTAGIPATDLTSAGMVTVGVANPAPGGGASAGSLTFTISNNPIPTITALAPASALAGTAAFSLSVTGTNFAAGSIVNWNGAAHTPTSVTATRIVVPIAAADVAAAGAVSVAVQNLGGTVSSPSAFTVNNPAPTAASLNPTNAAVGGPAFALTIAGSGFVSASTVLWGAQSLLPTSVTPTQIVVTVPASDIAATGTSAIVVVNPSPGGGSSSPGLPFQVANSGARLTSISPSFAISGDPSLTLALTGSGFVAGAVVQWAGQANLVPTSLSPTTLAATVPASYLAAAGAFNVSVLNPGTSSSAPQIFTVNPGGAPPPATPPSITGQPVDARVAVGQSAIFTVVAADPNDPTLNYQWFRNGKPIPISALADAYIIPVVTMADIGARFSCLLTNALGSVASREAQLMLAQAMPAPQLTNAAPVMSLADILQVGTSYGVPVTYNWSFLQIGPVPGISGAKASTFALGAPVAAQMTTPSGALAVSALHLLQGQYQVSVTATSSFGESSPATTTVITFLAGNFDGVQVYPNPWRTDRSVVSYITFADLTPNTSVKIFTVSGHLVRNLAAPAGAVQWDLRNNTGDKAASGIYLYLLTDGAGNKKRGKLVIVR